MNYFIFFIGEEISKLVCLKEQEQENWKRYKRGKSEKFDHPNAISWTYLNIGKRGSRMMAETADHVAGIAVVVGVATEGRIEAEFAALVG